MDDDMRISDWCLVVCSSELCCLSMLDAQGIAIGPESVARTLSAAVIGDDVYRRSASLLLGESDEVSAVALFPYAAQHMLTVHKLMFGIEARADCLGIIII